MRTLKESDCCVSILESVMGTLYGTLYESLGINRLIKYVKR